MVVSLIGEPLLAIKPGNQQGMQNQITCAVPAQALSQTPAGG